MRSEIRGETMRSNATILAVGLLVLGSQVVQATGRDVTDRERITRILGKWKMSNAEVVEFTDTVAFTHDLGEMSLTFFKIEGSDAAYSIIGNDTDALLFMKLADEACCHKLTLVIKTTDLLMTTSSNGTVAEWHRTSDDT